MANKLGMARFNFMMPDMLRERFRAVAEEKGASMASIINHLVSDYVNYNEHIHIQDLEERVTQLETLLMKGGLDE